MILLAQSQRSPGKVFGAGLAGLGWRGSEERREGGGPGWAGPEGE